VRSSRAHHRCANACTDLPSSHAHNAESAKYYRAANDSERGSQHADQALAHASEPRQPLSLLAAQRLLGELCSAGGRYYDAASYFRAEGLSRDGDAYVNDAYGESEATLNVDIEGGVGLIRLEVV
jgi:hypothetical protein